LSANIATGRSADASGDNGNNIATGTSSDASGRAGMSFGW
jgi:hypothetical protein